ncbi:MAG TPA: hypothetical protein VGN40_16055 [Lelliottia sp.]|jgi:hypothetical protein
MLSRCLIAVAGISLALVAGGCTDADMANIGSYGSKSTITCYSGGASVFKDESTGKVATSKSGAGVYYKSSKTGRFVHTYADCIVEQE